MTMRILPPNEISLDEFARALIRLRLLVIACTLAGLAIGTTLIQLRQPVFEASAILRIGQTYYDEPLQLESVAELTSRLSNGTYKNVFASAVRGTTNLVSITASDYDRDKAAVMLRDVVEDVITTHAQILEQNTKPAHDRIAQIKSQSEALMQQLASLNELAEKLRQKEPTQASVLLMQQAFTTQAITQLDLEQFELLQRLSPPQTRSTEVHGNVVAPEHPVQSKSWLILVICGAIGALVGALLVLAKEFVSPKKTPIAGTSDAAPD